MQTQIASDSDITVQTTVQSNQIELTTVDLQYDSETNLLSGDIVLSCESETVCDFEFLVVDGSERAIFHDIIESEAVNQGSNTLPFNIHPTEYTGSQLTLEINIRE